MHNLYCEMRIVSSKEKRTYGVGNGQGSMGKGEKVQGSYNTTVSQFNEKKYLC